MIKHLLSPAFRITFGIVCVTLSLILTADFLGLTPDGERNIVKQRQNFTEMLAIQLSIAIQQKNQQAIQSLLLAAAKSNTEVESAAIRRKDDVLIAIYGDHDINWIDRDRNTSTQMFLPLVDGVKTYAQLELQFYPIETADIFGIPIGGLSALLLFMVIIGSFCYWMMIRSSLQYLDPNAVVPQRVRSALDVLANGIIILDSEERIVLANKTFCEKIGIPNRLLLGKCPSNFAWQEPTSKLMGELNTKTAAVTPERHLQRRQDDVVKPVATAHVKKPPTFTATGNNTTLMEKDRLPWLESMRNGCFIEGVMLSLINAEEKEHIFLVNCSPLEDAGGAKKGMMVGFDDVTDIEAKSKQLHETMAELAEEKNKVELQNIKLYELATRDPLTDLYNRRAFNEQFSAAMEDAKKNHSELSCIMADIDHFKLVNDNHGHGVGDEVIKMIADTLREAVREKDVIGRLGGEEYCIILPGLNLLDASRVADRIRQIVEHTICESISVTCSFGVSTLSQGASSYEELIQQSDEALYSSKKGGRNQVTGWSQTALH
ncbi:MAG: diguanylate cyclase [Pseudomonadales bacterium]|nr:diguanylate cyclase [Pseudomonadales bacterium]